MDALPIGDVVCNALDPLLVPLGFAAGQGRGAFNSSSGLGVTYCANSVDFNARFPWMPEAIRNDHPEGWECTDIIVNGSPGGLIEEVYVEAFTLEETFRQLGLAADADAAANLIGQRIGEVLEPLTVLLRRLFRV